MEISSNDAVSWRMQPRGRHGGVKLCHGSVEYKTTHKRGRTTAIFLSGGSKMVVVNNRLTAKNLAI